VSGFVQEIGLPTVKEKIGVWRGISDFGLGETDLLLSYQSEENKVFVLMETMLNTSFQKNSSIVIFKTRYKLHS
jgi:hypothetical protein